ncbi:MAG: hypothetical protein ABSG68_26615, partial [Thermoguttaceae bacterium]
MSGEPEQEILRQAEDLVREAEKKEPLLSNKTKKVQRASAYYIVGLRLGRPISLYLVANMFDVSLGALRRCYGVMGRTLGVTRTPYHAERTRNDYDIYAAILKNDGASTLELVRKVRISTKYLTKYVS